LPTTQRGVLREYAHRGLAADARTVAVALLGCYLAFRSPSHAYLLLLTAVTANLWLLGRLRALPLTLGTMVLVAIASPAAGVAAIGPVVKDLPHVALFAAVVGLMGVTVERLHRARAQSERHGDELARLNAELTVQMEEVQTLSEHLRGTNDALSDALTAAERPAARASALQEVTAALSVARGVPDVADAVLERGLRAVGAPRGWLVVEGEEGVRLVRAVGHSAAEEAALCAMTSRDEGPLAEAMRRRLPVWQRSAAGADPAPRAHLALPLLHGDRVLGGLAFEFPDAAPPRATDELFTTLLSQATADALGRAQSYDAEREARRAAELVSRAREEVLGVVAHDLRNPLNLVGSSAQLLMEPSLAPERREAVYAIAMRAVQRMNRMVGDLLDVVRLESGHLSLEIRPAEVNRLLTEATEALRERAATLGVALELVEWPAPLVVPLDEGRVLQLVDNLVGNALKFTPRGGRVAVSASLTPTELVVAVADTGPGIPEEHLARLFDQFWQARGSDRRGIGLGLAIARGIAEAHGGRLFVESTLGRGSVFRFAMPCRT
jgi:signal transduction histidine kinase